MSILNTTPEIHITPLTILGMKGFAAYNEIVSTQAIEDMFKNVFNIEMFENSACTEIDAMAYMEKWGYESIEASFSPLPHNEQNDYRLFTYKVSINISPKEKTLIPIARQNLYPYHFHYDFEVLVPNNHPYKSTYLVWHC